jgi:hypothetical protein
MYCKKYHGVEIQNARPCLFWDKDRDRITEESELYAIKIDNLRDRTALVQHSKYRGSSHRQFGATCSVCAMVWLFRSSVVMGWGNFWVTNSDLPWRLLGGGGDSSCCERKTSVIFPKKRARLCVQAGDYLCLAQNGVGSPAQRTIRLQVSCKYLLAIK